LSVGKLRAKSFIKKALEDPGECDQNLVVLSETAEDFDTTSVVSLKPKQK
jgi:hypothetical protein